MQLFCVLPSYMGGEGGKDSAQCCPGPWEAEPKHKHAGVVNRSLFCMLCSSPPLLDSLELVKSHFHMLVQVKQQLLTTEKTS